jgi:predicted RNA-binding protein (virulence factor B family)
MNIEELIDELSKYPMDTEVMIMSSMQFVEEVETGYYLTDENGNEDLVTESAVQRDDKINVDDAEIVVVLHG